MNKKRILSTCLTVQQTRGGGCTAPNYQTYKSDFDEAVKLRTSLILYHSNCDSVSGLRSSSDFCWLKQPNYELGVISELFPGSSSGFLFSA